MVLDLGAPNLELIELNVSREDFNDAGKVKVFNRVRANGLVNFFNLSR